MGRIESSTSLTPSPNAFGRELASMAELSSYLFCRLELINLPRKRV